MSYCNSNYMLSMSDFIKNKVKQKHQIYENYIKNGRKLSDNVKFQKATSLVSEMLSRRKAEEQNYTVKLWYK